MRSGLAAMALLAALAGCATLPGAPGVVFTPSGKGPFPAVIVLHTRGGLQAAEYDAARHLSTEGYVAVAVDFHAKGGIDNIDKAYDFLARNPAVAPGRIGVLGFSQGGAVAVEFVSHSHRFTERRLAAIVSYFPGKSPALITGPELPPILFLHGSLDVYLTPAHLKTFCAGQHRLGAQCEAVIYEGVKHAFDRVTRDYQGYDRAAAADASRKMLAFFARHLKDRKP